MGTCRGEVKNKVFIPKSEIFYRQMLSHFEGKEVTLEVKGLKKKRSLNQNNTYWWWLTIISEHNGNTPEELHKIFKALYCPRKFVTFKGKQYQMPKSTTDLSTSEMMEYMAHIEREAAELGCILPEPDPIHSAR